MAENSSNAFQNLDWGAAHAALAGATLGAHDGEMFVEEYQREFLSWDDGRLQNASYDARRGFGLRVVAGETVGFAHSSGWDEQSIQRAGVVAAVAKRGHAVALDASPLRTNRLLYSDIDPIASPSFGSKTHLLAEIDAYLRARDPQVVQVQAALVGERRAIAILRPDAQRQDDIRPLVRLSVSVTVERNGRRETGSCGAGGREAYENFLMPERWRALADEALRIAQVNLEAVPAPVGEMDVVLGPGWPGVMLHEAVGHGLEGDFNRKGLSIFSGRVGERVAAPGVTIVDDGSLELRRGSINFDDEGTSSQRNVLIEDGILKGYMQDRMNARLMGVPPTGIGRRQSYAHAPMPRMTNTFMEAGEHEPEEIIRSLKRGIYARDFGGGEVDITNGKFVFQCTEAYLVEDGEVKAPIKNATLIGDGPKAMLGVEMIGNDLALDRGIGTCGKNGQSVPAGLGQPTIYLKGLTVGGG